MVFYYNNILSHENLNFITRWERVKLTRDRCDCQRASLDFTAVLFVTFLPYLKNLKWDWKSKSLLWLEKKQSLTFTFFLDNTYHLNVAVTTPSIRMV